MGAGTQPLLKGPSRVSMVSQTGSDNKRSNIAVAAYYPTSSTIVPTIPSNIPKPLYQQSPPRKWSKKEAYSPARKADRDFWMRPAATIKKLSPSPRRCEPIAQVATSDLGTFGQAATPNTSSTLLAFDPPSSPGKPLAIRVQVPNSESTAGAIPNEIPNLQPAPNQGAHLPTSSDRGGEHSGVGVISGSTSRTDAGTSTTRTKRVQFHCDNDSVETSKPTSAETRKRKLSESVHPRHRPSAMHTAGESILGALLLACSG